MWSGSGTIERSEALPSSKRRSGGGSGDRDCLPTLQKILEQASCDGLVWLGGLSSAELDPYVYRY